MRSLRTEIEQMFSREIELHGRAFANYCALEKVERREMPVDGGFPAVLFFNPGRVRSVMAMVDEKTLSERQCFLCPEGLGAEQLTCDWTADSGEKYWIRVNPFPIFDRHFTISVARHERQQIRGHFSDMLCLCSQLPEYLIFYNGPMCGASAPDHMHFQAFPRMNLPLEKMVASGKGIRPFLERDGVTISRVEKYTHGAFVLRSGDIAALSREFSRLVSFGEIRTEREWEPRMNIISWSEGGVHTVVALFRNESRPECFWSEDPEKQILISPGAVEMSGVAIVSSRDSFDKITPEKLDDIINEVSLNREETDIMEEKIKSNQAVLSVGVVSLPQMAFYFKKPYLFNGKSYEGAQTAFIEDGRISFDGALYDEVLFHRSSDDASFELSNVTIGVEFHWNRQETQLFPDDLKLIVENGKITAINLVGIEKYLVSVISSEMSATCSKALLKAHCIISRSWILAQIQKNKEILKSNEGYVACIDTEDEKIKWYDREDHVNFDVCADDHCQRYYGLSRASTEAVRQAVAETWGKVLMYDGKICDARFSKCCGGVFEEFEYCWEPKHFDYLVKRRDSANENDFPDLTIEENARKWILSSPDAFCNNSDPKILSQVMTSFDQETTHFYRWTVEYTVEELSALVKERSGEDYGEIQDLIPVARGTSGRLWKLKIVGSKKTKIIGKELEIRRTLSKSHLYSSAFVVEKKDGKFILRGAGWGHGAGMCQIGAAVMGEKGYSYEEILAHYFPGSELKKQY